MKLDSKIILNAAIGVIIATVVYDMFIKKLINKEAFEIDEI